MKFFIRSFYARFRDPIVLYILGILAFFSAFILAFAGKLVSSSLYYLVVNFLLLEYNYPEIRQSFHNNMIQHFLYSNRVLNRFLFYTVISGNLLVLLIIPYNILFILFSPSMIITIMLSIIINTTILVARLLDAKANLIIVLVLSIVFVLYKNTFLGLGLLSGILVLFLFMITNANRYVKQRYKKIYSAPVQERELLKIGYFLKYIIRLPLITKMEYVVIIIFVQIMSLFKFQIITGIDFFVVLFILELELITDGFFKDIHHQASMYYFYKKIGVTNFKYYTLSRYFYSGIIYSIILLFPIKNYSLIASVALIIVTFLLSYVYYTFHVQSIITKSKKNNVLSQFIIFCGLNVLFFLKNYFLS